MADESYMRSVGPVHVWRCTEAIDPKAGFIFKTIGDPNGRCVEIAAGREQLLLDRRLARQVAEAILAVCGPAEEEPADLVAADVLTAVYNEEGDLTGFAPYVGRPQEDRKAFFERMRADAGYPPSTLLEIAARG